MKKFNLSYFKNLPMLNLKFLEYNLSNAGIKVLEFKDLTSGMFILGKRWAKYQNSQKRPPSLSVELTTYIFFRYKNLSESIETYI